MEKDTLKKGINLGGWLSQYQVYDAGHFKTFIQYDDIQRIAGWGFDHIRLPVDYPVIEDEKHPRTYLQNGFDYVHACLDWCDRAGLRVIFDLHKAPGYAMDAQGTNQLEDSPDCQNRLIDLWEAITREFLSTDRDLLAFEILNEVNFRSSERWNDPVEQVIQRIRPMDAGRLILIGGNHFNSVNALSAMRIIPDVNILYKFHFYLPFSVTHQKAYWVEGLQKFNRSVEYPGAALGLKTFLAKYPEYCNSLGEDVDMVFDRAYLAKRMEPAAEFSKIHHQPVHCGEFGVIDRASLQTRKNWIRDCIAVFHENGIGHAYWSYKNMDFGMVDEAGKVIDQELLDVLVG